MPDGEDRLQDDRPRDRPRGTARRRLPSPGRRGQVAGPLGRAPHQRARPRPRRAAVLQPHDVPLPLGRGPARREHVRLYRQRRERPVQAAAGARRLRADRVRRVRHPQRELRDQGRHQPRRADPAEHRELPPPAPPHRRHVRLATRAEHHGSQVLQVDPVDLPPAPEGGEGLQEVGGGQLVPARQDRAGQRAGHQRPVRALRHGGGAADAGAVVLPDHRLRRRGCWPIWTTRRRWTGRTRRPRRSATGWAGRRARSSSSRLAGASDGRRDDPRLHHPGRHHLRRHVHGARPRAPAGGPPGLGRPAAQGGRRLPQGGRVAGPGLPQGGRAREDRRLHRRLRRQSGDGQADPGLDRRLRINGIRHRRHHGRAGARRARLRVRREVRPADRPGGGARAEAHAGAARRPRATATRATTPSCRSSTTRAACWSTPASSTA